MTADYIRQLRREARRYYELAQTAPDAEQKVVWLQHAQTMVDLADAAEERLNTTVQHFADFAASNQSGDQKKH